MCTVGSHLSEHTGQPNAMQCHSALRSPRSVVGYGTKPTPRDAHRRTCVPKGKKDFTVSYYPTNANGAVQSSDLTIIIIVWNVCMVHEYTVSFCA